jgi:major vault protein
MVYGPSNYIPSIEVEVLEKRETIPLDKNEGIYIRDTKTGQVDVHMGSAYMLKSHEELWEMELPESVENLLKPSYFHTNYERIKHKVVSFRAPFNSAVQVYDYKAMESRIVFGPDLVTLKPDESFTQISLSGKTPKKPGMV